MTSDLNPLLIRKTLGKELWKVPTRFGPNGWIINRKDDSSRVIVSCSDIHDISATEWIHASISHKDRIPDYEDLKLLHKAVFEDKWAYQLFAPPSSHINIHERVLHLWGRADGKPCMPDFGSLLGSI